MSFDIEVEMESGLPEPLEADNEITAIGFHDTVSDDYTVLVLDKKGKMEEKRVGKAMVIPFQDERNLLLKFLELYEGIRPDILTGWNSDYFDTPYLYNRLKKVLGKKYANRLSPIGECFWSPYRQRYFFAGVSCLDYMGLYKNYNYTELPNYRLDTVGKMEIGRGKIEYDGNLDDLFEKNIEKFIEYNLVDVEILVELDKKLQFIDLCRGICHVGHVPYEDFVYSSKWLEGALLTYLKRRNLVAPNKPADKDENMEKVKNSGKSTFLGAYVKDPLVGKYEWIYDLDLTSLYPSIIMTLNISPETKFAKIVSPEWDAKKFMNGKKSDVEFELHLSQADKIIKISHEKLIRFIKKENLSISSNGVLYRLDKVGCIPGILDLWFNKRVEYKNLMKKWGNEGNDDKYSFYFKRQLVQKIMLNSLYGVLGLPAFRFYDKDNAEAVTTSGRLVIRSTADMGNIKYQKELGEGIEIIGEDDTKKIVYQKQKIKIKRNGIEKLILGSELKEGDVLV